MYKLRNRGGFPVSVNYQSLLSNFIPLAPLIIFFSIKYRRNKLLLESFIELPVQDFMIYQLVDKRTEIIAIATSNSQGCRNPGGMGEIYPPNSLRMVHICIPPNNLNGCTAERKLGGKKCSIFDEDLFFLVFI